MTKSVFLFKDVKKAYDSVPRAATWLGLKRLGVPDQVVAIMDHFMITCMQAQICLNGDLFEEIDVNDGLRQKCCMAPALFNICLTLEPWNARELRMHE